MSKSWAAKNMGCEIENLKRYDWQINFSIIGRHDEDLSQFDFFEQSFDRRPVQFL